MIGIDMELPKSCKECAFCEEFCEEKFCKMESVSIKDENIRQSFCPLVDLGKEDMSWDELKEKAILKKETVLYNRGKKKQEWFALFLDNEQRWEFFQDGHIYFNSDDWAGFNIFENQTPFHMWQIIQVLVGER